MTVLNRQLEYRLNSSVGNYEDWWSLIFDTETKILCVEHQWAHVGTLTSTSGKQQVDVATYLKEHGGGSGQQKLERVIASLFLGVPIDEGHLNRPKLQEGL
jgi:hypothetical protein